MQKKYLVGFGIIAIAVLTLGFFALPVQAGYGCDPSKGGQCCPSQGNNACPQSCSLSGATCYENKALPGTEQKTGKKLSCKKTMEAACELFSFGAPKVSDECSSEGDQPFCIPIIGSVLGWKGSCALSSDVASCSESPQCPSGYKKDKETTCTFQATVYPQCCDLIAPTPEPTVEPQDLCKNKKCPDTCDEGVTTTRLQEGSCDSYSGECVYSKKVLNSKDCGYKAPAKLAQIDILPVEVAVSVSDSQQFALTAYDTDGNIVEDAEIVWSVSNESIGTISETGLFTASRTPGTAFIQAIYGPPTSPYMVGTAVVNVITLGQLKLSPSGSIKVVQGVPVPFIARGFDAVTGKDYPMKPEWTVNSSFSYLKPFEKPVGNNTVAVLTATSTGAGTVSISYMKKTASTSVEVAESGGEVASVEIIPTSDDLPSIIPKGVLTAGKDHDVQFYAVARDSSGTIVSATISWDTSNVSVALIDQTGVFHPRDYGEVTIFATASLADGSTVEDEITLNVGKCSPGSTRYYLGGLTSAVDKADQTTTYDALEKCDSKGSWGSAYLMDVCAGAKTCGPDPACDRAVCGYDGATGKILGFGEALKCCPDKTKYSCDEVNDVDCSCSLPAEQKLPCTDANGAVGFRYCQAPSFTACSADPLFLGGNTKFFQATLCLLWGEWALQKVYEQGVTAALANPDLCGKIPPAVIDVPPQCLNWQNNTIQMKIFNASSDQLNCLKAAQFASFKGGLNPINCFESENSRYTLKEVTFVNNVYRALLNRNTTQPDGNVSSETVFLLPGVKNVVSNTLKLSVLGGKVTPEYPGTNTASLGFEFRPEECS